MAIQTVNIGAVPNDGTGDNPRTGISKLNDNFTDPANAASKLVGTATGQIPIIDDLGSSALVDTGTAAGEVPTNGDLGTASTKNVQASPSDATAGAVLNNETTHIGGNVNYTDANYQPSTPNGIGVVVLMKNNSGSSIASGEIVSGSVLQYYSVNSSGILAPSGLSIPPAQNYKNVSPFSISDQNGAYFSRQD